MAKPVGFSVAQRIEAAGAPFLAIVEDNTGQVSKTPLGDIADVVTLVATGALTAAEHANRRLLLGEVGGNALVTLDLPAATGSGDRYEFWISVVNTSNYVIEVDSASATIDGSINSVEGGASYSWSSAAASDTLTFNGTTSGGAGIGDWLELVDIATNQWAVRGQMTHSGIQVTPFSAAV